VIARCAILLALLLLTGCGGGTSASSPTGSAETHAGSSGTSSEPNPAWKPLITLNELGRFSTRCGRRGDQNVFAVSFTVSQMTATSTVTMSTNGGRGTRRVLQPGQRWVSALAPTRFQTWRIAQGTEPQTIAATVRIRPSRCPYGVPTTDVHYGTAHFNSP